jgi:hypothetical protein
MEDNKMFRKSFKRISEKEDKVRICGPKLRLKTEPSMSSLLD